MKVYRLLFILAVWGSCGFSQNRVAVEPALEVLSQFSNIRDFALSSSTNECYTTLQSPLGEFSVLLRLKKIGNEWSAPESLSFSGKYSDLEPFLSTNGLRLYFASNRPLGNMSQKVKDYDIWYVERKNTDSEWGDPINLGAPINTEHNEFYPSLAENNNLYFTSDNPNSKGKDDLYFSRYSNGEYDAPKSLSDSINTDGYEFNGFISTDESFFIYSGYQRKDGLGSGDMYISFRDENGEWGKGINLGAEINSKQMDYCPFVDSNSKTLYFTSKRSAINEVNDFKSLEEVEREANKYENGFSRIYKISLKGVLEEAKR